MSHREFYRASTCTMRITLIIDATQLVVGIEYYMWWF